MWRGPKSAWKALYSSWLSTEKYTGGCFLVETGFAGVARVLLRDDRLLGDLWLYWLGG
jgi:DMSO reductase anchor subunit